MDRRHYLRGAATPGVFSVAGCLEQLGFEEESVWRNPPLVDDRPNAVYIPASRDSMGMYGRAVDGDVGVALMYSVPHRFWLVDGTDTERVEVGVDDTHHLMWLVWDTASETVIPTELTVELAPWW
ncbi:MAG: hypothetical protein U5K37_00940 [Natrialbaceae archaeon]|nr:hypothetical protein [Natrialbaceae archaeon]